MAILTHHKVGYVKDDDAKTWKADELLQSLKDGLRPLRLAGAMKVAEGVTTIDEVLRSTPQWG
mgnify:CR=1 FL=1